MVAPDRPSEPNGEPPSNEPLLDAMRVATGSGDRSALKAIYEAFKKGSVIVPIRDPEGSGPNIRAARMADGRLLVPAFTDGGALGSWAEAPVRWAAIRGRELASFAIRSGAHGVVLNPAGPFGGELGAAELRAVAESEGFDLHSVDPRHGMTRMAIRGDAGYELQPAAGFPPELAEGVGRALGGRTDVLRAYPLESTVAGGQRSYTVGLELAPGADASSAAVAIGARLPAGRQVDVLPLAAGLVDYVGAHVDPIWTSEGERQP